MTEAVESRQIIINCTYSDASFMGYTQTKAAPSSKLIVKKH